MVANHYFFTGFPGFLAGELIRQIIRDDYDIGRMYLLVLPDMLDRARAEVQAIVQTENVTEDRFTLVPGDITEERLAMPADVHAALQKEVTHVYHLAAIYDLAVKEDIARRVNVTGTKNVNDWVMTLENLARYVYFSTAYVAGKREGKILETELAMQQDFKNHYERTKFEAEVLVSDIADRVPTTVIRPGVARGHSKTGETIKFDGPYFMLNYFDKLRWLPFIPYSGRGEATFNTVPSDYIIKAAVYLGHADKGRGKTYHLTDPHPYKMRDVYRMLMEEFLGKMPRGTLPLSFSRGVLSVPFVRKWLRVEKEALDYFITEADFDCTQAREDLQEAGIVCPDFKDTVKAMVRFYAEHKDDPEKQLDIR